MLRRVAIRFRPTLKVRPATVRTGGARFKRGSRNQTQMPSREQRQAIDKLIQEVVVPRLYEILENRFEDAAT
jgi:hypothetical protein